VLDREPRLRRSRQWPWYSTALVLFSGLATIGLLIVVVEHRDSHLPKSRNCPTVATVNRALGTRVAAPSVVSESDLLGCFYPQGADPQAVSVSFAIPDVLDGDPCKHRPMILISRHEACNASGSRGTSRTGRSLLVEERLQYQFSSDLFQVSLAQLERLAAVVLAMAPPPVQNSAVQ
jgi:hypothetical protein